MTAYTKGDIIRIVNQKRRVTSIVPVDEASISAVVIRCGCPEGEMDHPSDVCYRPRATEDKGIIAYSNKNPIKQAAWDLKQAWKEGRRKDAR